jgi:flavodoxin
MDIKRTGKIAAISIIVLIVAVFGVMGLVIFDVMSYTATGSEKLSPNGTAAGTALVVYDPGFSGQAQKVATTIAQDLEKKGYEVELAGISSSAAKNNSNYDIIVVGGPVYAGNVSSSVQTFLNALKPSNGTKVAAFVTGSDPDVAKDPELLLKQAAPLAENSTMNITAVMKVVPADDISKKCAAFVEAILNG